MYKSLHTLFFKFELKVNKNKNKIFLGKNMRKQNKKNISKFIVLKYFHVLKLIIHFDKELNKNKTEKEKKSTDEIIFWP